MPRWTNSNLDVAQLVCNELTLKLPMRVLCDEECKGIRSGCGINPGWGLIWVSNANGSAGRKKSRFLDFEKALIFCFFSPFGEKAKSFRHSSASEEEKTIKERE